MLEKRLLNIDLAGKQSTFLWGARKTGKSTYLKQHYPGVLYYDLLMTDEYLRLLRKPWLLREDILAKLETNELVQPVIIDEVQKVPLLLDEVHWLIENKNIQFILCGSSARKLKRGGANLLGGRAFRYEFYPLVYKEIENFVLVKALNQGLLPAHYLCDDPRRMLKAYVQNYLIEEIKEEGLTRNLASFADFLEVAAFCSGQLINASNVARDCGISSKTVQEYYQILEDTMLGYSILPYSKKKKRDLISAMPKFYLFDLGVVNYLTGREVHELKGSVAGEAFEHFILMEIMAYRGLNDYDFDIKYWRTKTRLEVDFILGRAQVAVEVKVNENLHPADINGLIAFKEENPEAKAIVVVPTARPRVFTLNNGDKITLLPWQDFIEQLWQGKLV